MTVSCPFCLRRKKKKLEKHDCVHDRKRMVVFGRNVTKTEAKFRKRLTELWPANRRDHTLLSLVTAVQSWQATLLSAFPTFPAFPAFSHLQQLLLHAVYIWCPRLALSHLSVHPPPWQAPHSQQLPRRPARSPSPFPRTPP